MHKNACTIEFAEAINRRFERELKSFLRLWIQSHEESTILQFDQSIEEYLDNDALRDFFLNSEHPVLALLNNTSIASHLGRDIHEVYFDPISGDPLLSLGEQRIYNLARRMDAELMHIPFRYLQPNKQTEAGDGACIHTYPADCEELRYNSGNHFTSRSANDNVFDENSKHCLTKSQGNLHILFKKGFLEERLHDVKELTAAMRLAGETQLQYFVIYSRHSPQEGHFGVSIVIMDPANPNFPVRVMVCDTLLKELPKHPRWWHHFIAEYSNVFGDAIAEIVEDLSHPLQKVNIKGDDPFRHDWDCPYYAASMANALADLVNSRPEFILEGGLHEIHDAMKAIMPDYYEPDMVIKERQCIKQINLVKRWKSGYELIKQLINQTSRQSSYEL